MVALITSHFYAKHQNLRDVIYVWPLNINACFVSGIHAAAKETIALAEERFLSNSTEWEFDNAWQEMLNHATIKVMAAEKQKTDSEAEHLKRAASFTAAEQEVQRLQKKLQRYIQTSQPYFEQKDIFNKALESQKKRVQVN